MIGDYDTDPGAHPHDEAPIFKVWIRFCYYLRISAEFSPNTGSKIPDTRTQDHATMPIPE